MKSVGEVMAIGRTFAESLQKALRGLETGLTGLDEIEIEGLGEGDDDNAIKRRHRFHADAGPAVDGRAGARLGATDEEVHAICKIDPWFLAQIGDPRHGSAHPRARPADRTPRWMRRLKADGLFRCPARLAHRQARP
jgi:carbamoyl-phosphate synthase large subunit